MLRIALTPQGGTKPPIGPGQPPLPPGGPDVEPAPTARPDGQDQGPGGGAKGPSAKYDAQKASPQTAGYLGPEDGPFECEHCHHFEGPGSCELVSGKIDPHGCCNLFERGSGGSDEEDADQDIDQGPAGSPAEALMEAMQKGQGPQ